MASRCAPARLPKESRPHVALAEMALLLTEKPGRARPVPSGASRIAPVAERGLKRTRAKRGAPPMQAAQRLPVDSGPVRSSDRGECDRAAGIGLTIQIAANHSSAIARSYAHVAAERSPDAGPARELKRLPWRRRRTASIGGSALACSPCRPLLGCMEAVAGDLASALSSNAVLARRRRAVTFGVACDKLTRERGVGLTTDGVPGSRALHC